MVLPDNDDYASLGGGITNAYPVANPQTDIDAAKLCKLIANVASMVGTSWRAWALVDLSTIAIASHGSQWGDDLSVKPVPSKLSTGVYAITWPTSIVDDLGASHTLALRAAARPGVVSATLYHAQIASVVANVVTFNVWNAAGALAYPSPASVFVAVL